MKRILCPLILFVALLANNSWAIIARVGTVSVTNSASTGTWTHTLSQVPTIGNLIVISVATNNSSGSANDACTVTDSGSNTLSQAVVNTSNAGTGASALFIDYEIVPSTITTAISIVCTGNGSEHIYPATSTGYEYSGVTPTSPVDVTATGASGFSGPIISWTTSSATTTSTDLLVGEVSDISGYTGTSYTPSSGWTAQETYVALAPSLMFSDQINISPGTYAYSGTYNNTPGSGTRVNSAFASFKAATVTTTTNIIKNATLKNATIN